ncbi:50S ribosomal protein L22 [Candidatus Woesearchaeota archaeon]|nr:50S ribosomal protein L22 [Candidatus Woesearchaeota archaeon]
MAEKTTATLRVHNLPISTKMAIEICGRIRNQPLAKAQRMLQDVVSQKRALPIKRFNHDLSHKPGMAAGRFPLKAASTFLDLLHSVKANAEHRGLHPERLLICFAKADKGPKRYHPGRQLRTKMKNTIVELHLEESQ